MPIITDADLLAMAAEHERKEALYDEVLDNFHDEQFWNLPVKK